jgi:Arc/MetJ-type ribon-helix-helix transcriptional regulator
MDVQTSEDFQRFIRTQLDCGRYASEEEAIRDFQQWLHQRLRTTGNAKPDRSQDQQGTASTTEAPRRFWEAIDDLMKDVPEEELAKLPTDGAKNLDHYLYGAPRRQ